MQVEFRKEPFEHYVFNDFFSKKELNDVLLDLEFIEKYTATNNNRHETGAALDVDGNSTAQRNSIFLNALFTQEVIYNKLKIYQHTRKLFDHKNFTTSSILGDMIKNTNQDSMLINFYKDGDFYKAHYDDSVFTFLGYLWKGKKDFSGGVLNFHDYNYNFDPKFNSAILFPGCIKHSIDKIVSLNKTQYEVKRVSITMFIGHTLFRC